VLERWRLNVDWDLRDDKRGVRLAVPYHVWLLARARAADRRASWDTLLDRIEARREERDARDREQAYAKGQRDQYLVAIRSALLPRLLLALSSIPDAQQARPLRERLAHLEENQRRADRQQLAGAVLATHDHRELRDRLRRLIRDRLRRLLRDQRRREDDASRTVTIVQALHGPPLVDSASAGGRIPLDLVEHAEIERRGLLREMRDLLGVPIPPRWCPPHRVTGSNPHIADPLAPINFDPAQETIDAFVVRMKRHAAARIQSNRDLGLPVAPRKRAEWQFDWFVRYHILRQPYAEIAAHEPYRRRPGYERCFVSERTVQNEVRTAAVLLGLVKRKGKPGRPRGN
jgi:hypothetical protein